LRRGFRHVRVFGSVRRSQATPTSDVDLLVDREPGTSLLERAALGLELERLLRRKVDVVPEESLHWLLRPQVLFEAEPL
jgi:predicted nucleotidyltransferase